MKFRRRLQLRYAGVPMSSRFVSACLVLILFGAGVAPCPGWQPTSQARLDCCVEGQCPDKVNTGGHPAGHSRPISQARADVCCATSEQQNQESSSQIAASAFLLAPPIEIAFHRLVDARPPAPADLHADRPLPPLVPLHLLFSVFLV